MDSRNPSYFVTKRKTRAKCHTIIHHGPTLPEVTFEFFRFRFRFRAIDAVFFPPGKSTNVLRGAFGTVLRDVATPCLLYTSRCV